MPCYSNENIQKRIAEIESGSFVLSKFALFSLLATDVPRTVTIGGVTGMLVSVEREDGSGKAFNVTLSVAGIRTTVFVRTD